MRSREVSGGLGTCKYPTLLQDLALPYPMQASHASTRTHAPHDAAHIAAAHMISRRSAPCFRRGESAAFDRIRTAIVRHRRDTGRDPRTSQPLHARSQLRGRCLRMYRARIARQDRAGRATLTAKSRLAPTANEAAPRDRSAIAQRVGAPAQTRARAAATRRRAWLQSALRDAEHRPRSRGASRVVPLVMPIRLV